MSNTNIILSSGVTLILEQIKDIREQNQINDNKDFVKFLDELEFLLITKKITNFISYFMNTKNKFLQTNNDIIKVFLNSLNTNVFFLNVFEEAKKIIDKENQSNNQQIIKTNFSAKDIEEMCLVMNAFVNGAEIVYRNRNDNDWFLVSNPKWNWKECEYAIRIIE